MEHSRETSNLDYIEIGKLGYDPLALLESDLYQREQRLRNESGRYPRDAEVYQNFRCYVAGWFKKHNLDRSVSMAAALTAVESEGPLTVDLAKINVLEDQTFYPAAIISYPFLMEGMCQAGFDIKQLGEQWAGTIPNTLPEARYVSREVAHYVGQNLLKRGRGVIEPYAEHWLPLLEIHPELFNIYNGETAAAEAGIGFMIELIHSNLQAAVEVHNDQVFGHEVDQFWQGQGNIEQLGAAGADAA